MSVPRDILDAIGRAVEAQGGTLEDALDLAEVWERQQADSSGRVDRLRHDAANAGCRCADGGSPGDDGRCGRCRGRTRREQLR